MMFSYVVHFCRTSEIPGERINALNISVLHKAFKHKILEIKNHGRRTVTVSFNNIKAANAIISHPILKENNLAAYIPMFRVMRTDFNQECSDISDEEIFRKL